jgi:arginyl-tRNA--protein-N-Asp/Glu arginylyltransferase
VLDRLENGLSAIYTYYEPAEHRRSLGSYVILWQIERARDSSDWRQSTSATGSATAAR